MGAIVASCVYLLLWRRYGSLRWFRIVVAAVLGLWVAVVLWSTVFNRSSGENVLAQWVPLHSYRAVRNGGNQELMRSNFMNITMFYPGGLLTAPFLSENRSIRVRLLMLLMLSILLSLGIELCQLCFALGNPEIDDVIHNTLGATLGGICFFCGPFFILCKTKRSHQP